MLKTDAHLMMTEFAWEETKIMLFSATTLIVAKKKSKDLFNLGGMFMKPIPNFENYSITLSGRVINNITGKCKKPSDNHMGKGYLYVDLYKNGKRTKFYVHRLVAEAYIPNPENKPYINHKDGNPKNNCVDNLEWCTPLENVEHASKILGVMCAYKNYTEKSKRAVIQIDRFTKKVVAKYESIREASNKTGIPTSNIVCVLKGRQNYTKDFYWCYVEEVNDGT